MASDYSFDITCDYNHQEMVNAIDQTKREIENRYDFKGVMVDIKHDDKGGDLTIQTDSDYKLTAILDILESKMVKRELSLKILDKGNPVEQAAGGTVRQRILLRSGLKNEDAKAIVKIIRDHFPKAKPNIQGEEIRVNSKSKDELQEIMQLLRGENLEMPLQFGNYR
jgi:uncharacterized protein YajQ (UPF0234 family)